LVIQVALNDQVTKNLTLLGSVKVTAHHDAQDRVQANVFSRSFLKESLNVLISQLLSFVGHVKLPKTVKRFDLCAVVVDRKVKPSPHQKEDNHVGKSFRCFVLH
jgi:hypothetical protein